MCDPNYGEAKGSLKKGLVFNLGGPHGESLFTVLGYYNL